MAATAAPAGATLLVQLQSQEGVTAGPAMDVPASITPQQLELLINDMLKNVRHGMSAFKTKGDLCYFVCSVEAPAEEEPLPYSFFLNETELSASLADALASQKMSSEKVVTIVYVPQAVFRVRPVTRCSGSLPGHSEAVLSVAFSPDSRRLVSGSGDATVRFWDMTTNTPLHTCKGHQGWVLCVAWSPDSQRVASGSYDGTVRIWSADTGACVTTLKGHKKWVTSVAWEPFHLEPRCLRVASSSKDGDVRIWDVVTGRCLVVLAGHTGAVSCVRWGGDGLLYTASYDRTVKVWDASGKLVRSLDGHAHRVNHLALSTDYVLRTGPFDHTGEPMGADLDAARAKAQARYQAVRGAGERLCSCSDDLTMFLWEPSSSKKSIARMTGHQQLVNHVAFSPDGRFIASASFDGSVRLWDGFSGKFLAVLRGHVQSVYQVAFSGDGRMLVSGSKDSTMKVWDLRTRKLKLDLPGHADEVYSVDWSADGGKVASGSKDHLLKVWSQ